VLALEYLKVCAWDLVDGLTLEVLDFEVFDAFARRAGGIEMWRRCRSLLCVLEAF